MEVVGHFRPIILAGIFAATLSTALGCINFSPKIFQVFRRVSTSRSDTFQAEQNLVYTGIMSRSHISWNTCFRQRIYQGRRAISSVHISTDCRRHFHHAR